GRAGDDVPGDRAAAVGGGRRPGQRDLPVATHGLGGGRRVGHGRRDDLVGGDGFAVAHRVEGDDVEGDGDAVREIDDGGGQRVGVDGDGRTGGHRGDAVAGELGAAVGSRCLPGEGDLRVATDGDDLGDRV